MSPGDPFPEDLDPDGGPPLEDDPLIRRLLPPLADRSGPAHRRTQGSSQATARAAVETALAIQERFAQEAAVERAERVRRPRVGGRRMQLLVAAAVALLSIVSLGAVGVVVVRVVQGAERAPAPPAPPARVSAPVVVDPPMPPPEEDASDSVEEETAQPEPRVTVRERAQGKAKAKAKVTRRRRIHSRHVASAGAVEVDLTVAPVEDLFALANRLRRTHEWRTADEVYGAVCDRFPGTDAAVVAEIASATLHLEPLRDPAGALAGYRRALGARPTGALAEEARWGIAEAYREMGNQPAELGALKEFLDRHPGAGLAPAARKRIAQLDQ